MAAWTLVNLTEHLREAISSLQVQKGKEPRCTQGSAEQGEASRQTQPQKTQDALTHLGEQRCWLRGPGAWLRLPARAGSQSEVSGAGGLTQPLEKSSLLIPTEGC